MSVRLCLVGSLAGGIAHDFNNLLTVVTGHNERLLRHLPSHDPLRRSATSIREATKRAATLTQQLLAFSRQQVLQPRVLALNEAVTSVCDLLVPLIGEDVTVVVEIGADVGLVKADPDQLGQALMNLAVDGSDPWLRALSGAEPGPYVTLTVSDTGCGMDAATVARVFDPFFSTKEPGKGTGLGLSTVYGIVMQSGGQIRVESEPGRGSTFTIYLPQIDEAVSTAAAESFVAPVDSLHGTETILLVEDEDDVRTLLEEELMGQGYTVLTAADGVEALRVRDAHTGPLHLLLTDLVMPRMTGRDLARRLTGQDPTLKVLLMSGYASDRTGPLGDTGPPFLPKPFSINELALRVRTILNTA